MRERALATVSRRRLERKTGLLSKLGLLPPILGVRPAVSSLAQVGAPVADKCLVRQGLPGQWAPDLQGR